MSLRNYKMSLTLKQEKISPKKIDTFKLYMNLDLCLCNLNLLRKHKIVIKTLRRPNYNQTITYHDPEIQNGNSSEFRNNKNNTRKYFHPRIYQYIPTQNWEL